ncbi:MAG TPA: hypothetical protein EYP71_01910 [Dehalococcoidia bacterium]|nr:hypothetical protein [Dehalococcoidia bacterium]
MRDRVIRYLIVLAALVTSTSLWLAGCDQASLNPPSSAPPATQSPAPHLVPAPQEEKASANDEPEEEQTKKIQWYRAGDFSGSGNKSLPPFHIYGTQWRIIWEVDATLPEKAALDLIIYCAGMPGSIWKTLSCRTTSGNVTFHLGFEDHRDFSIKVFARNLQQWTVTIEDSSTPVLPPIKITYIHYQGTIYPPDPDICRCYERVEPDEYVVIKNLGDSPQPMGGWVLKNLNKDWPIFTFPHHFVIEPGAVIRVYTSEVYPDCEDWLKFGITPDDCAPFLNRWFSFYWGPGNIWDNDKPNTAVLYNSKGEEISRKSYAVPQR